MSGLLITNLVVELHIDEDISQAETSPEGKKQKRETEGMLMCLNAVQPGTFWVEKQPFNPERSGLRGSFS